MCIYNTELVSKIYKFSSIVKKKKVSKKKIEQIFSTR